MGLKEIRYQEDYRSGYDNIVEVFFRPSLSKAKRYWRAVGYFSSSAFESFGSPLGEFVRNGGYIRLVTSVELAADDLRAIANGASKQRVCADRLVQIVEEEFADGVGEGTVRLSRLLEIGRLEIRIAVPTTGTGTYHEKIGLFLDDNDFVAFTGSSNESRNAFENNRECIDVFPSWEYSSRAVRKRAHFEALWNHNDKGVDVYSFPEAAKKKLLRICEDRSIRYRTSVAEQLRWRHQDEAMEKFLAAERGVLNMATGTGKTRTALKILHVLFERQDIDTVIVCTDGNDLLDQWYGELLRVRRKIDHHLRVFRQYRSTKELQGFALEPNKAILLVSRTPVASALRQLNREQARRTLLVHDEVHGLGSPGNRVRLRGLSENVRFRLGLSATPEREYDQEGNVFIESHIGPVLMTFDLKEAIERGILAPFNYFPLSFELTDADRKRIASIFRRRAASDAAGAPMTDEEVWMEIARVYKTSEAKLPVFNAFIRDHREMLKRSIVFTDTKEYGQLVLEIIHKYRSDFHTYFSGEQSATLDRFARGELECLITCHRLSEGIDIRSLSTVILFSSERARLETIQRIGRCLRTNPHDIDKTANIVDFIRRGDENETINADEERRDWLLELSQVRPLE